MKLEQLTTLLKQKFAAIEIVDDICVATKIRQQAVLAMADDIDICIVVGDQKSSNSRELYELARQKVTSYQINDIQDIDLSWFINKQCCGITAGASTPSFLIESIIDYIDKEVNHG